MTLSNATNSIPNENSAQYKKSCTVAIKNRKHIVHNFRSSLATGLRDIVTVYSSSSCTQTRSVLATCGDRSPNGINRLRTGRHRDSIQEMIDSIVANSMVRTQRPGPSREDLGHDLPSNIPANRPPDSTMMKVTSQADLADDHTNPFTSPASNTVDIAFNEDTRWRGVHPFNVKVKNIARFEALIPHGYRYARDLQVEAAFIPPLHHPRNSPGKDFVLQKRGTSVIPIVDPKTVKKIQSTRTGMKASFAFHNEVRNCQDLTLAARDLFSVRHVEGSVTQVDLPSPPMDPPLPTMVKDFITINELEVLVLSTGDPSGFSSRSTNDQPVDHSSTCAVHNNIEEDNVGGFVGPSRASLINTIRRRTRRRQA